MSTHGYSFADLRADYFRAGVGFAATAGLVALGGVPSLVAALLVALGVLFAAYGFMTYTRQRTRIHLDDEGLIVDAWRRTAIRWSELSEMRLSYFASRRERVKKTGTGWMQLRLKGPGNTVRIESSCEGFNDIVARAAAAALENRLAFGGATLANLESLNIPLTAPSRPKKAPPAAPPEDVEPLL